MSGLRVNGNVLTGRSTTNVPIVHVERQSGLDDPDVLHQVIVRARVSEGANLTVNFSSRETLDLYDHRKDPLDQNDIASENPEMVERLSKQLDDWRAWALANKLPTNAEATEGLDAAELERLRSLGYVQ